MTVIHHLRVHRSDEHLAREGQLAWRIAEVAADPVEVEPDVVDMIINRVIDNAAVAAASLTRAPVSAARQQALDHAVSIGGVGRDGVRLRARAPHEPRVGGVGERRRRARARLPRHVPRRRVLAPRRQHPADPRGRPARRRRRRGARARARHRLRDPDRPRAGDLPAQAQDRPRRPPRPVGRCRHRHAARPRRRDDLPGRRPGAAHHDGDPPVPQGRDLDVEGARARVRRKDGGRGRRPRDARRDVADADLRRRRRRHRVDARRTGCLVRGAAARGGRAQARHPRLVHEGALGRVPGAGLDRPRPQAARRAPRAAATRRTSSRSCCTRRHHTHYVIGSGANDPQKYDPHGVARDARPLDPVHLRGRAAGRRLAPRRLVRPRARRPRRHRRAVAQDHDGRGRRSGRAATTRTTRTRRRSAAASRSASPTADRSSTRSPSPTRTRSAHGRSPARTTSASSACWPSRCSPPTRSSASSTSPSACPSSPPKRCSSSRSSPRSACSPVPRRRRGCSDALLAVVVELDPLAGRGSGRRLPDCHAECSLMLYSHPGAREAPAVPRAARDRRAAAIPGRVQPAQRPAHRAQGLRGRLHLGRGAQRRPRACPTSASRRSPRSPAAGSRSPA